MCTIKELFVSLNTCLLNNDYNSCDRIIKHINWMYRKKTNGFDNETKVDLFCDINCGGLHCLSLCLNDTYNNKLAVKLAKCLRYQIVHFSEYFMKYAERILTICSTLMKSKNSHVKYIGAEILNYLILSKKFSNLETSSIIRLLLDQILYVDVNVKNIYYELLGAFCENVSSLSSGHIVEIENFIVKEIEQFGKAVNPKIYYGFLTALDGFYNVKANVLPHEKIYYILRSIIQSDRTTKPSYCGTIHLLNKHMRHFIRFMTDDFEIWHNTFTRHITEFNDILKENNCLKEVSVTFYQAASRECQQRNIPKFQHFYEDIDKLFANDAKLPVHSVKCLKYFIINNTNYLIRKDKLFYTLASEFTTACKDEVTEKKDYIGTYLECLASLVFNKKSVYIVNSHHEAIVLKFLILTFKNYSNFYMSCDIVLSVYNVLDYINNIQPDLLKKSICQILRSQSSLNMNVDKITTQQYQALDAQISLWKDLIAAEQAGPGHPFLYDCLMEQTIVLFEKLDLDNSKKSCYDDGNSPTNTSPLCCNDVKGLENLIYLIEKILKDSNSLFFKKWTKLFFCKMLKLSEKIPHSFGIYRLITTVSKLILLDDKFKDQPPEEVEGVLMEMSKLLVFMLNSINKSKTVKMAFLKLLSILPEKMLIVFLNEVIETFINIFKFETSDVDMVMNAVLCIENWIQTIDRTKMEKFLEHVSPHMKYFVNKDTDFINVSFDCEDKLNIINSKWLMIQQKILQILTANRVPGEKNIEQPAQFSLAVAFPDQILKINLGCVVTHIVHICVNSLVGGSVRITACEMLYVLTTGIVGQCARLCLEEQKEYIHIFEVILKTVLKLGCDSNPVINALFRALSLQVACAMSSAYLRESFSEPFVNLLLDDKNWVNDKLRDLAATCIYEFLNCYLKKRNEDGAVNVEFVLNTIIHDLSCDVNKRLVATKLLNVLLPQLIENITFFDKYIIYLIYSLISSLNLNLLENDCVQETFDIVCNAIKKFGAVICKDNLSRIKPEALERVHVSVLLSWLLEQCYTGNAQCRAFSMRVYAVLRNVCIQEELKLEHFTTLENFEILNVKKLNLVKIQFVPWMARSSKVVDVLNWMNVLHGLLEYHIWLVNGLQIQPVEHDMTFILGLCLYIDIICNKDKSNNPVIQTLSTRLSHHNLESLKMSIEIGKVMGLITVKILEFFSLIHVNMLTITDSFSKLLLCCMTQPSTLGIELNEENDKLIILYFTKIINFLKKEYEYLWCKLHEQILSTLINAYLVFSNKLPQILKGIQSYTDSDIDLMSGIKYLMAADDDSNRKLEIIVHLEQLPVMIKSSLKDDDGVWLRDNLRARSVTEELIRLQLTVVKHQQLWQDLTECNCQNDEKLVSCVCQIYFNLFVDAVGEHILVGCDQIQLGDLCSFMKLNIINKLLTCFKYDLLERFLYRLKVAIIEQSQELIHWADRNTHNLIVLTNLLYNYSSYEQQMTDHYKFNDCLLQTHFEKWIFNMIRTDSIHIDFIPFVIYFSSDLFEKFLSHINETSTTPCTYQVWNNLLLYFDITGNEMVLYHLLKYLKSNNLNLIAASYKCIMNHADRLSANCQLLILQTAHHISINEAISYKYRANFLKNFYLVILKNMDTSIQIQFYQSIFEEMYSYDKSENCVYYKIVLIQLLEMMIGTLDRTTLEDKVLNNSGQRIAYSSLLCNLISRCYSARKELQNNVDNELWRIYQCVSFNCLITMLSRNYEDCISYNYFLFREKSDECSIWDSLVDSHTSFVFPAYRTSVSQKYYTSFIKVVNMKDLIFSGSSTSLTQECTKFDFVGHRTTLLPKEKCVYIGCSLEVDSLNEHECMGAICAVIVSLGRTADSAPSKEMPVWMKSFNNCLRNPKLHINTRTFLIKIIFNTRDIFQCYAKHWMGPILYSVNNGACGSKANYFYCQVVSMLVNWHNIAIPDANNYEGKYASNIVSLLATSIVGKDKKEMKRNLLLLSSCLIKWKDILECSLDTFVPLIKSNDPVDLKSGLNVVLLYLKNKVMPFKIHEAYTFFNLIVNLSNSLLQSVYKIASEIIGLFLVNMCEENCQRELIDSVEIVKKCLNKSYIEDKSAFLLRLERISMHYAKIIDRQFIEFLSSMCLIPKLQPIHKIAIDILCKICSSAGTELETTLSNGGIFQLLSSRNDNDQLNIIKLLTYLCDNNLLLNIDLNFDLIINLMKSSNLKLLTTTWDLLLLYTRKKALDKNKINNEVVLCRLIDGIWSRDEATHSTAVRFFLEVYPVSSNVLDVLILLLENLNEAIMADRNCVSIILEVLLEMSIKSPHCSDHYLTNVFECDYKSFLFENIDNAENINLINSYQFGDYPYTEITYEIIAKLLQNLGKKDPICSVNLLVAIVNGLLQQTKNYEIEKLKLASVISKILNWENVNNYLRYFLLEIARCNNMASQHDNEIIEIIDVESDEPVEKPPLKRPKYTEQVQF